MVDKGPLAAYLGVAWRLAVRLAAGRALRKPSEEAREEGRVLQEGNGNEWIKDVAEACFSPVLLRGLRR